MVMDNSQLEKWVMAFCEEDKTLVLLEKILPTPEPAMRSDRLENFSILPVENK
jgi:hypothetical protein